MKFSQNNVLMVLALIFLWLLLRSRGASGYAAGGCCGGMA